MTGDPAAIRRRATGALACAAAAVAATCANAAGREWTFRALLDGKPIGEHRFSVSEQGAERRVRSEASFTVRFLGFTAYRYRHEAVEQWHGDCLSALSATTDDDGKASVVRADTDGDGLRVAAGRATQSLKGCVMSFAYWNPAIRSQTHLLNAQTGRFEAVQVSRVGTGSIEVRGTPMPATHLRITGPAAPIDLWYSLQGEWLGLDSTVAGGRTLSYRLR